MLQACEMHTPLTTSPILELVQDDASPAEGSQPTIPSINLPPGKVLITQQTRLLSTILGSCVAVCLHSKKAKVGAMCHSVLPFQKENKEHKLGQFPFVDSAINHMLSVMHNKYGVGKKDITIKVFGGANVLKSVIYGDDCAKSVGHQNIFAARRTLAHYGLKTQVEKVGGKQGYKIYFNTDSGEVYMRRISSKLAEKHAK